MKRLNDKLSCKLLTSVPESHAAVVKTAIRNYRKV